MMPFGVKPIIKRIFDVCVADVNDPSKLLSNLFRVFKGSKNTIFFMCLLINKLIMHAKKTMCCPGSLSASAEFMER